MNRLLLGLGMTMFIWLAGCSNTGQPMFSAGSETGQQLPRLDREQIKEGQALYAVHCASCHGLNLEGETDWKQQNEDGSFRSPPHTADGHTWHHADSVLLEAIRQGGARFEGRNVGGTSGMPAFTGTLTEEEMLAVLTFIKSTWPAELRAVQWQQTNQESSS